MLPSGDELRGQNRWARRLVVMAITLLAAGIVWWNDPARQAQDPSSSTVIVPKSESDRDSRPTSNSDRTGPRDDQRADLDDVHPQESGASLPTGNPEGASKDVERNSQNAAASAREMAEVVESDVAEIVRDVTIRNLSGQVAFRGDINLRPTLDRIAQGIRHSHGNDGTVFRNFEGRLPKRPSGYYHEFVHPTPGLTGPGPQRVVTGRGGEIYYTPNHYQSFRKIR